MNCLRDNWLQKEVIGVRVDDVMTAFNLATDILASRERQQPPVPQQQGQDRERSFIDGIAFAKGALTRI